MNNKAIFLFIFAFSAMAIWLPLHFSEGHYASLMEREARQSERHLHPKLNQLVVRAKDATVALKDTVLFPEKTRIDRVEATMEDKAVRIWNTPYFLSVRQMTETAVMRFYIALAWFAVMLPALFVVVADALTERKLKYETVAAPHPVLFEVALSAPIYILGTFLVALIWPYPSSLALAELGLLLLLAALHVVVSHFHKYN